MVSEYELFQSREVIDLSTKQASGKNALYDNDGAIKLQRVESPAKVANKIAPDSGRKMETPTIRSQKETSESGSNYTKIKGSDGSRGNKSLDSGPIKKFSEKFPGYSTSKGKEGSRGYETLEAGSTMDSSGKVTENPSGRVTENPTLKGKMEVGRQGLIEDTPVFQIGGPLVKKNDLIVRHCEDCGDCSSDRVIIDLKINELIKLS